MHPKLRMRRSLARFGAVVIVAACLWGHVSELFDHWDNTFRTGNDVESSVIIAALAAGIAFGITFTAAGAMLCVSTPPEKQLAVALCFAKITSLDLISHSPPPALRI